MRKSVIASLLCCGLCAAQAPESLGDELYAFDVGTPLNSDGCLGVAYGWGHFWVSARGVNVMPPHLIGKFDANGSLVAVYQQHASANLSAWGGRDGHADEDANQLYFVHDNGVLITYAYDPATGDIDGGTQNTIIGVGLQRALAKLPNGLFVSANLTPQITEFHMPSGNVTAVGQLQGGQAVNVYGLAFDKTTQTLWTWSQDVNGFLAEEYAGSTASGWIFTGRTFLGNDKGFPASGPFAGGADVYCASGVDLTQIPLTGFHPTVRSSNCSGLR